MKPQIFKPFMKGIYILILTVSFAINANAQAADFTGEWKIELEKSDLGSLPKDYAASQFKFSQDNNTIKIMRIINFKDSTTTTTEVLNFNGALTTTDLKIKRKQASIKWSSDRNTLIETADQFFNASGKNGQYQSIETFKLSDDKTLLFYTRQVKSDKVNFELSAVYKKI